MTSLAPTTILPPQQAPAPGAAPPANKARHAGARWIRWTAPIVASGVLAAVGARAMKARDATPVHYETAAVDRGRIDAKVTATGTVSAIVTVQVGAQVSGRITQLFVDFNSPVKKGQVIATIDPALFRAAVAQARANLLAAQAAVEKAKAQKVQAERQWARSVKLNDQGLTSRADLDVAEANALSARADMDSAMSQVAQARANLDQAELNLRYATIVSPIDGTVISRNVDVGQTVAAALQAPTLFTIGQDLTKMQVDTNVAEADVGKLRERMDVTFTVDAYPGRPFHGKVRQVRDAAQTVQNVVTYDAVIDFDNGELLLKPGMTASASFVYAQRADTLRLPNGALRFKPDAATTAAMQGEPPLKGVSARVKGGEPALGAGERRVWILRRGQAHEVTVKIGITDGTTTEVVEGDVRESDPAVTEAVVEGATSKHP